MQRNIEDVRNIKIVGIILILLGLIWAYHSNNPAIHKLFRQTLFYQNPTGFNVYPGTLYYFIQGYHVCVTKNIVVDWPSNWEAQLYFKPDEVGYFIIKYPKRGTIINIQPHSKTNVSVEVCSPLNYDQYGKITIAHLHVYLAYAGGILEKTINIYLIKANPESYRAHMVVEPKQMTVVISKPNTCKVENLSIGWYGNVSGIITFSKDLLGSEFISYPTQATSISMKPNTRKTIKVEICTPKDYDRYPNEVNATLYIYGVSFRGTITKEVHIKIYKHKPKVIANVSASSNKTATQFVEKTNKSSSRYQYYIVAAAIGILAFLLFL